MITTYFCRMGNHHATLEEMKTDTIGKLGNGKCKKCHSTYSARLHRKKAVQSRPWDYSACNDCDEYFYKYTQGGKRLFGKIDKELRNTCFHCGSTNIEGLE